MRKLVVLVVAVSALWLGTTSLALAAPTQPSLHTAGKLKKHGAARQLRVRHPRNRVPTDVPELDPNAAGLAFALLAGAALLVADRRRAPTGRG